MNFTLMNLTTIHDGNRPVAEEVSLLRPGPECEGHPNTSQREQAAAETTLPARPKQPITDEMYVHSRSFTSPYHSSMFACILNYTLCPQNM